MHEGILPQTCDIMRWQETSSRTHPASNVLTVLFPGVPCRLDTLLLPRMRVQANDATDQGRLGGVIFIIGNFGEGASRLFNEKDMIRVSGYDLEIQVIHDVWGADSVDHYEVEVIRGVSR
jgi:hypothetical protein